MPGSERVFAVPELEEQKAVIEAGWIGRSVELDGPVPLVTYARPVEAVSAVPQDAVMEATP
ncbi:hypothetical protein D3C72_2434130 [compost metagenome]